MRVEGCGEGDGVVFGGARPFTDAKLDDDVFDHDDVSSGGAVRLAMGHIMLDANDVPARSSNYRPGSGYFISTR